MVKNLLIITKILFQCSHKLRFNEMAFIKHINPFEWETSTFSTFQVLIVLDADPRSADAGVWCTMFFIYMTYTLLALHVEECTVSGLLLGFTQVCTCFFLAESRIQLMKHKYPPPLFLIFIYFLFLCLFYCK